MADPTDMTLAFSLSALKSVESPKSVLADAKGFTEYRGVVSDTGIDDLLDYIYYNDLQTDFTISRESLEESLDSIFSTTATNRHVFIGAETDRDVVSGVDMWEFLPIEDAASDAGWDLSGNISSHPDDGDVDFFGDLDVEDESEYLKIDVSTHKWHSVNRDEKNWVVKSRSGRSYAQIEEGDHCIFARGVGEGHKYLVEIQNVVESKDIDELFEEVEYDELKPNDSREQARHKIKNTVGEDDIVAFRVKKI